jgi:hypothetical protein
MARLNKRMTGTETFGGAALRSVGLAAISDKLVPVWVIS